LYYSGRASNFCSRAEGQTWIVVRSASKENIGRMTLRRLYLKGNKMPSPINLVGQVFGYLTVVEHVGTAKTGGRNWVCRCVCGNVRTAPANFLRSGHILSCGCIRIERLKAAVTVHGKHGCPEYKSWNMMLQRCTNPNYTDYKNYGGRGITVCQAWHSFEQFYRDMGSRSLGTTLDRINNDGNYEPSNCRWADRHTQALNKRPRRKAVRGSKPPSLPTSETLAS
jgi:hypothetical protein